MEFKTVECPLCGKDDQVRKVSAIVASGVREILGEGRESRVYTDHDGYTHHETYTVPYRAEDKSKLAQSLSPPQKPSFNNVNWGKCWWP